MEVTISVKFPTEITFIIIKDIYIDMKEKIKRCSVEKKKKI